MKRVILLITCLFCLGCHTSKQIEPEKRLITSDNFDTIIGTKWVLQQMALMGKEYPLAGDKPFIRFVNDSKVNGFASINRFFGSVKVDEDGQVSWSGPFGMTRMAGPPELMDQEDAFLKALPQTDHFSISGIHLYAASKDEKIQLVFFVPVK